MAFEQLANNAQTTTTGAIDGSTNPVTVPLTSALNFPTAGNFRIIIDSEILLVTAVAGLNLTASRAQEGTSIASHLSGAAVTHILTKGSFLQVLSDFNMVGLTAANRPAAGVAGRTFRASDGGGVTFVDTGAAWNGYCGDIGPFTPPIGNFTTWVNQGTGSVDETSNLTYFVPSTSNGANAFNLVARVKAPPATPYNLTLAAHLLIPPGSISLSGLIMRDSTSARCKGWGRTVSYGGTALQSASVYNYTNPTTSTGNAYYVAQYGWTDLLMLRINNDGTTLSYQQSADFRNWTTITTEAVAANFVATIDTVGFGIDPYGGTPPRMTILHCSVG